MARKKSKAVTVNTSVVIYLRVSTPRQGTSGLGVELQRAKCLEAAARMGLPILSEHIDKALSGKLEVKDRPGLQDAIAAVQATPGAVLIVYSISRLGRTQRIIWELLDANGPYALPLISASEPFETSTPLGRAMLGMLAIWSTLEGELISERTVDALAAAKARGTKLGAPAMTDTPEGKALCEHVAGLYASGRYSLRSLADHLNAEGVASVLGGRWHPRTVSLAVHS